MGEKNQEYYQALTDSINANSNANFVKRLQEEDIKSIPNWEDSTQRSSHKLMYSTGEGGKVYVYPMVQEINGELHDFTDPKHKHGEWDAFKSAIKNGDYVEFPSVEDAKWWTSNNYKQFYKGFQQNNNTAHWLDTIITRRNLFKGK
jgi:hypothetical protein